MLEQFEQIAIAAMGELEAVRTTEELDTFRIKYLGRKGLVTNMLSLV
jgi:hypothetical protein